MATKKPHILIIITSTRQGRNGDKVAKWVFEHAQKRDDFTSELVDLRDYKLPFYDEAMPASMLPSERANPEEERWVKKVASADGYLLVTAEYNHGPTGVLKNALDLTYKEWNRKAVGYVAYGGFAGGARAVEQLRQITAELQMASAREQIVIPAVWEALDENGNPKNPMYEKMLPNVFNDLVWWTNALKNARETK